MPSFIFFSDQETSNAEQLIPAGAECIVPAGFDGIRGEVESRQSKLRWHCGAHTPLEIHRSNDNGYAFLIGEAIAENTDEYLSASALFESISEHPEESAARLSRYSGFFAWVVVLDDESIHCGSDPFGLFPIYYFQGRSSLSIATSINSLHAHPEYDASIDPVGFCRYLLESGCCSHRTIETSGKRLNITESIRYLPKTNQLEKMQHPWPGQDVTKSVDDLQEAVQLSAKALNKAVERHTQRPVGTCLLSGGLDSRQVLSSAVKYNQYPKCVTLGSRASYESIHARKAAKQLGLSWECSGDYLEPPDDLIDDELNLLSLGGGFNGLTHSWGHVEPLRGTRCLTGLCLDVMYAPSRETVEDTQIGSFEHAEEQCIYHYGALPEALPTLFRNASLADALDTAMLEVRAEWNAFPKDSSESYWHTIIHYHTRAHHGRLAWKNAFYFWPVMPGIDLPLVETLRTIDGLLMRERTLQTETFVSEQAELARIPFASVSSRPRPLILTKKNKHYRRLQKLERSSLQFLDTLIKHKKPIKDAGGLYWKEAKLRALRRLDASSDLFDIDSVKQHIDSFYQDDTGRHSLNRTAYSQRQLIGAICWLASRQDL
ncbi:MAG TPA: hypothetical protein DCX06_13705 [Opitutae bacterium]|nr:hypothetical protein [Opitutae bacterium]